MMNCNNEKLNFTCGGDLIGATARAAMLLLSG